MFYMHKYYMASEEYNMAMKRYHENNPCPQTQKHYLAAKKARKIMMDTLKNITGIKNVERMYY